MTPTQPDDQLPSEPAEREPADRELAERELAEREPAEREPDERELAERRVRANRATRGALAALLCLEAFVVLLVPRAIAQTSTGLSTASSTLLIAFAVVLVGSGLLLRRPWGIGLGSALQVGFALTIILVPLMTIVVIFFASIWLYLLQTRHQVLGTPDGWKMLIS